jgi:hypothetical protein
MCGTSVYDGITGHSMSRAHASHMSRCPAMSIKEQGLLLLYSLHSLLPLLGSSLGHRGVFLGCVSSPFPHPKSWASFHRYHSFHRAVQKYNFSLMRASRGQIPSEPGFSPGSPCSGKANFCLISATPARDEVPWYHCASRLFIHEHTSWNLHALSGSSKASRWHCCQCQ